MPLPTGTLSLWRRGAGHEAAAPPAAGGLGPVSVPLFPVLRSRGAGGGRGDRAAPGPPFIHGHAAVGAGRGPRRLPANGRRRRRASRGLCPMGARRA